MSAFNSVTCPQCKNRVRWRGAVTDRPACFHCGHRVNFQELEKTEKKLEEYRRQIFQESDDAGAKSGEIPL